ncbi:MAG TPA: PQQ-binding-like beta-propeller repeat protein [Bacteroidia bacterium]|nr:PQQ-binding-like beta-propeller repeat protein [Bacteroidia bacterium]HNT80047.1 PQQ-binding-like beta-propeller repeat protein [Bacteroidia bacterium]
MKKILFTLTFMSIVLTAFAQEEMSVLWETKCGHKLEGYALSDELQLVYGADPKEVTLLDAKSGSVVWTKSFKEIAKGLNKIDEQIVMWEAGVIFLFDRKTGKDKIACVDVKNGNFLWMSDKYQNITEENVVYLPELESFAISTKAGVHMMKARTGEELWTTTKFKGVVGAYFTTNDGFLVMLNYKPTALAALFSGFKNQIVKINTKNGDIVWDQTFIGMAERKVITRERLAKIELKGDKVFLFLNGIQVYDYNTGTQLWSAAFDADINVVSPPAGTKAFGVYGVVADPVVVGQDVYVIDMVNKKKQYIKKYDINSGKLLWTSAEIDGARALPGLYVSGNTVLLQIGGVVECQAYIRRMERQSDGSYDIYEEWRVYYRNVKPNGVQAFDASTGQKKWDSERFKKGITNMFVADNNVYVCSGKALYSMNIESGNENYEVHLGDDGIGLAELIKEYKDKVLIIGEKGLASHTRSDGKLVAASKYKKADFAGMYGKTLLMQTEKSDIAAYDVETCKYKDYNARKGSSAKLSNDGMSVYVWERKTISKLSTQ